MVQRIHQVIDSMIKTQQLEDQALDYINPFGKVLASIAWAILSSYHRMLEATPAQLVFGRDMIFNIKMVVNWDLVCKRINKIKSILTIQEKINVISHSTIRWVRMSI
jgi:hypothetical protein